MHIEQQSHLSCATTVNTFNWKKTFSSLGLSVHPIHQIKASPPALHLITKYLTVIAQVQLFSPAHEHVGFSVLVLFWGYSEVYVSNYLPERVPPPWHQSI